MSKTTTLDNAGGLVLIAGMSEGLGTALEQRFVRGGYRVVATSRRSAAASCDLSDVGSVAHLFRTLDATLLPLRGVIHNAMSFERRAFADTPAERFESIWKSSVLSAVHVAQAAIPRMSQLGGTLIFTGASGSLRAGPGFSAFSSAKFALRGLAQALSQEHARDGIHVAHVVVDGLIRMPRTFERFKVDPDTPLIEPETLAEQYWHLFHQPPDAWTHEIDVRPHAARAGVPS